ncbi:hypothetical protein OnM2_044034 [Erysiphe neolycopersici]|uniref:Mid2 domain-containing protein n=1 Tax=Erysiphe neolycopersici TaxID=212602 RepID=A0A420HUL3_9PEZI|nr:hypothetical protein OnM2_044034 [Erysiphe neolycopersici]
MRIRESRSLWLIATPGLLLNGVKSIPSEPYTASFETPIIQLNETTTVGYQVNLTTAESTVSGLSIVLCQTSDKKSVDATNSWQVLNILSGFCLTTSTTPQDKCKNKPYKGRESLQFTLLKDAAFNSTGDDSLDNFFLCTSHEDTTKNTICDYSSSIFNISPAADDSKLVEQNALNLVPASLPTPTLLAVTITSTKSAVLQTSTPEVASLSTSIILPKASSKKKKKGLHTAGVIGIAFGIFSFFLVIGLIGLVLLRRSSAKKRAQAANSLSIKSFTNSNLKTEKDNSESPTSQSGWGKSQSEHRECYNSELVNSSQATPIPLATASTKGGTDNEVHTRDFRRKSGMKRNSVGSVSISPIPSLRSESIYDPYRNGEEGLNTMMMNSGTGMGSTVPYLREEGMSAEEMARLEDEERRIDAAIAAAEAEKLRVMR